MSDENRSARSVIPAIGGVILAVIAFNLLLRVVPLPDIDLPDIDWPDLPGWVRPIVKVKNLAVIGLVLLFVVGAAVDRHERRRRDDG